VGGLSRGVINTTMTKEEMLLNQATEHKEVADLIISNVAKRNWKKGDLVKHLDRLYMMGTRHGWESAGRYLDEQNTG
jgi:hypothetical protein